jgi:hypothetical protein
MLIVADPITCGSVNRQVRLLKLCPCSSGGMLVLVGESRVDRADRLSKAAVDLGGFRSAAVGAADLSAILFWPWTTSTRSWPACMPR